MKLKNLNVIVILIIIQLFRTTNAEIRYVSKTGNSSPPYTNWQTAADTIQKAINYSNFGDTIYVANGLYIEKINMKPGISLIGGGIDSCIIDPHDLGNSDVRTVTMESDCLLQNFCIKSFSIDSGYCVESWMKLNVVVKNNKFDRGKVGVFPTDSKILITGNIFSNYYAGILLEALSDNYNQLIEKNVFYVLTLGINLAFGTRPIIYDNIFYLNDEYAKAFTGGNSYYNIFANNLVVTENAKFGLETPNRPILINNNMFLGKFTYLATGAWNMNVVKNNLILNSKRGIRSESDENPIVQYNCVWNTTVPYTNLTPDSTNISVDPMLVNEDSSDYHLQKFSPLIDAGDPSIKDKDGSRSDIGLYGGPYGESYTYQDLAPKLPRNLSAKLDSNIIVIKWLKNTEADFGYYKVYRDTVADFIYDSSKAISKTSDTLFAETITGKGKTFYYKVTAFDNTNHQSPASEEVSVVITEVDKPKLIANDYMLYQNYPNPFNPTTTISYRLKERGKVKLTIYNIQGKIVTELVNKEQEGGYYEVEFNPNKIRNKTASGIYVYYFSVIDLTGKPVFIGMKKTIYLK